MAAAKRSNLFRHRSPSSPARYFTTPVSHERAIFKTVTVFRAMINGGIHRRGGSINMSPCSDSELCISQGDQPGGDEPDGNAAKSPSELGISKYDPYCASRPSSRWSNGPSPSPGHDVTCGRRIDFWGVHGCRRNGAYELKET